MGITFREAVAEVELGLVAGDQLSDIATAGLLEGYESPALVMLAGQFGEPYDPVEAERLWTMALGELNLPNEGRLAAAKLRDPSAIANPFYKMLPEMLLLPMWCSRPAPP